MLDRGLESMGRTERLDVFDNPPNKRLCADRSQPKDRVTQLSKAFLEIGRYTIGITGGVLDRSDNWKQSETFTGGHHKAGLTETFLGGIITYEVRALRGLLCQALEDGRTRRDRLQMLRGADELVGVVHRLKELLHVRIPLDLRKKGLETDASQSGSIGWELVNLP